MRESWLASRRLIGFFGFTTTTYFPLCAEADGAAMARVAAARSRTSFFTGVSSSVQHRALGRAGPQVEGGDQRKGRSTHRENAAGAVVGLRARATRSIGCKRLTHESALMSPLPGDPRGSSTVDLRVPSLTPPALGELLSRVTAQCGAPARCSLPAGS